MFVNDVLRRCPESWNQILEDCARLLPGLSESHEGPELGCHGAGPRLLIGIAQGNEGVCAHAEDDRGDGPDHLLDGHFGL